MTELQLPVSRPSILHSPTNIRQRLTADGQAEGVRSMCLRVLLRAASCEACVKICSPTVVPASARAGTAGGREVFARACSALGGGCGRLSIYGVCTHLRLRPHSLVQCARLILPGSSATSAHLKTPGPSTHEPADVSEKILGPISLIAARPAAIDSSEGKGSTRPSNRFSSVARTSSARS